MNKQRLQDIANNTATVNENDISEIKHLIGKYPYFALPHIVLAKVFFEREHYLFENALNQAAMRVADREWLYHYVHAEHTDLQHSDGVIKLSDGNNQDIERLTLESATIEDKTPTMEADLSAEIPLEINEQKNDLSVFLEDSNLSQSELAEPNEIAKSEDITHQNNKEEQLATEEAEEIILEQSPMMGVHTEERTESEENILEQDSLISDSEEAINEDFLNDDATMNIALNLRKHPVYNVEEFLQADSERMQEDANEEKNFYYWLKHPKIIEQISEDTTEEAEPPLLEHKLSIIDQFIKSNPGISRPKKEFFNAENMAKKSEYLDLEFVSETLANIYYEQGNIDLAIKAYEKLSLQNPQKQTYFATLIEKIKKEKR